LRRLFGETAPASLPALPFIRLRLRAPKNLHARLDVRPVVAVLAALLLGACASEPPRKATPVEPSDGPSTQVLRAEDVVDAVPRVEPRARYGNHSPYEVFGRKYHVLTSSEGYHERGTASWYGSKFHGRRTSSGEPYDMHLATAAHKSLPLPTYAEVTNLDNGRRVIVKVNDRGPFKDERLIDLSYGAALRLDMIGRGTARVEVRAIDPRSFDDGTRVAAAQPSAATGVVAGGSAPLQAAATGAETWLQAGAFGRREGADQLAGRLRGSGLTPVSVHDSDGLYRVWLGPYGGDADADAVIQQAIELGFERPHRVRR
jgi:rare lipoprotein A